MSKPMKDNFESRLEELVAQLVKHTLLSAIEAKKWNSNSGEITKNIIKEANTTKTRILQLHNEEVARKEIKDFKKCQVACEKRVNEEVEKARHKTEDGWECQRIVT